MSSNTVYLILMFTCNLAWLYSGDLAQLDKPQQATAITLPEKYQHLGLEKCSLSHLEEQFAKHFPGVIEIYQYPKGMIIFRQVTGATRKLHNSRTCLKASGFILSHPIIEKDSSGAVWQTYTAEKSQGKLAVRSSILSPSDGKSWSCPEDWFWDAFFSSPDKAYLALTEISEVNEEPLQGSEK